MSLEVSPTSKRNDELASMCHTPGVEFHGPHHVTLTVTDLDRASAWYREILGFGETVRYRNDAIAADCAVLAHPDAAPPTLGLRQYDSQRADAFDERHIGLDHIAFNVGDADSLEEWQAHLRAHGVAFTVTALPELTILVMRDPDNIQLELCTTIVGPQSSIGEDGRIALPPDA